MAVAMREQLVGRMEGVMSARLEVTMVDLKYVLNTQTVRVECVVQLVSALHFRIVQQVKQEQIAQKQMVEIGRSLAEALHKPLMA